MISQRNLSSYPRVLLRVTRNIVALETDTVLQAVGATERCVVFLVSAFCASANTVAVNAVFEFDDGSDVPISRHPGIAAGSGYVEGGSGSVPLAIGAAGQDLLVTVSVPTTGSIQVGATVQLIRA